MHHSLKKRPKISHKTRGALLQELAQTTSKLGSGCCTRPVRGLSEKHFYFKMLVTFEPNVAQRSVASQNNHKSKACLPEASNTTFTMYRRLKRRLRRLYKAPFLAPHSSSFDSPVDIQMSNSSHWSWVSHIVICAD